MSFSSRWPLWILFAGAIVIILTMPVFFSGYILFVLSTVGIYTIVTLGLNVLVGTTGQLSIGHAAFFAIGAYTATLLMLKLNLPYLLAIVVSAFFSGFCGLLVGIPATKLSGPYLGIATLGFGMLVQQVLREWEVVTGGRNGLSVPSIWVGPYELSTDGSKYYLIVAITVLSIWLIRDLLRSPLGLAWRALKDTEVAAQAVGIKVSWYKALAFGVSAFFAGLAGALYAPFIGYINYESFGLMMSISFLSAVILGGLGSITGSVLGAAYLALAPEIFRGLEQMQMIAYGLVMTLVILVMPKGLMEIPSLFKRIRSNSGWLSTNMLKRR